MNTKSMRVVYILPSRYDDEGYVHRYWRGVLPSNTLCVLRSLTEDLARSKALGEAVDLSVEVYDDSVQAPPVEKLIRQHQRRPHERLVIGLVGVQSNMFPRASDLALRFRQANIPVLIGGFHVSGVLKLFDTPTRELERLLQHGVTLVQGEAEAPNALAGILKDALENRLQPIYRITELPVITDAPVPQPADDYLKRFMASMGTIDTSRGCPFNCSFCTIINVQGRKMRSRSASAILKTIEENYERGFRIYFFTDDNLSRSPVWESLFDGLIELRKTGKAIRFMMQVDTQAWKIPRFREKASQAGCSMAFIGMESVNPANLEAMGKKQNKVEEFAQMVQAWREADILVHVGYIIGLPYDTPESVRKDIHVLKDTMKVDQASFFMLTPIPGSRDHLDMVRKQIPLDADLNNFDSFHETFRHPNILPGAWRKLYEEAWDQFYAKENMVNILLRASKNQYWNIFWQLIWNRYATFYRTHPMLIGFFRRRKRTDRRPSFRLESRWRYFLRRTKDVQYQIKVLVRLFFEFQEVWLLTRRPDDERASTLRKLHERWADAQQRLIESDLSGQCDLAAKEIREVLCSAADSLRQLAASGRHLSQRVRRRLDAKVHEIETRLQSFEMQRPSWRSIIALESYISENLLNGYEELTIRYVAKRRYFNKLRRSTIENLRSGHWLHLHLFSLPHALLFEISMGIRFAIATWRNFADEHPETM